MKKISGIRLGVLLAVIITAQAYAQTPAVPAILDPGRLLDQATAQPITPVERQPKIVKPKPLKTDLIPEAKKIKFKVSKFVFKGNTIFTSAQMLSWFKPGLNKTVSLAQVQEYVTDIGNHYRKAGYALSLAILPPQEIKGGIVKIRIIEGYISTLKIEHSDGSHTTRILKEFGDKMMATKPLQVKELVHYALLLNDIPGMKVQAVLTPAKNETGAAQLTLVAKQSHLEGTFKTDKRGTKFYGPERFIGTAYLNTMMGYGASTYFRMLTVPDTNELQFYQISHNQYLDVKGDRAIVSLESSRSVPGFVLRGTNTIGESQALRMALVRPFIRSRSKNLYGSISFKALNSDLNSQGQEVYDDRIRTLAAALEADGTDKWRGYNSARVSMTQGIDAFGANQPGDLVSRIGAFPGFTKFDGTLSRVQGLFGHLSLMVSGHAQYALDPLYVTEQIGYGGEFYGQAYDPSEIVGDRGAMALAELRFTRSGLEKYFQFFVFYDAGVVWNINFSNQPANQSASSAGLGARVGLNKYINFSIEFAKPLTKGVATSLPQFPTFSVPSDSGKAWRFFYALNISLT